MSQDKKYLDYYLAIFKFYRKYRKGYWYKHEFTTNALQLSNSFRGTFWARYGNINRFSKVILTEKY